MIIGLYLNDKGYSDINMSNPNKGNPGIGGTQYMYLMFGYYMKVYKPSVDIVYFHYNDSNCLPVGCKSVIVNEEIEIIEACVQNSIDVLLHDTAKDKMWYQKAHEKGLRLAVWAECYVDYPEIQYIKDYDNVKRLVLVGHQEYDRYVDDTVIEKCTYIYNMFPITECKRLPASNKENIVTYMGSLNEEKGFHILAKHWKKVVRAIPDARLVVIGSGRLYSRESRMGKFGLSEEHYENRFMRYLTDSDGRILDSVEFKGIVGNEKEDILKSTKVGIVNPSAVSETFCISAVEMETVGVPVVTKRALGLCDTVRNKVTGLSFIWERDLPQNIIKLLKDDNLNDQYSINGISFAREKFDPMGIIAQWYKELEKLEESPEYIAPSNHFFNDWKWVRVLNRKVQHIIKTSSIVEIKYKIKKLVKKA